VYPSTLVYTCAAGYEFDAATWARNQTGWCTTREVLELPNARQGQVCSRQLCVDDGAWAPALRPVCVGVPCAALPAPADGVPHVDESCASDGSNFNWDCGFAPGDPASCGAGCVYTAAAAAVQASFFSFGAPTNAGFYPGTVDVGLGRIVALCCFSSASYHIR
jgi:hypothetical protein